MNTTQAIIIDDELIGIETLSTMLNSLFPGVKIAATTTSPESGISLIESHRPEIVFLDISMPTMSGFELLDRLKYKSFKLVFTTAHEQYALKAIKNRAFDYLLKPIDRQDLKDCVSRILDELYESKNRSERTGIIELRARDGIIFIRPDEIIRLQASGSYTEFYLDNGVHYTASKNLKECSSLLENLDYFFRCHSSHTVNLKKVVKMITSDGLYAKMNDGSKAEILRKNKDIFLQKLLKL